MKKTLLSTTLAIVLCSFITADLPKGWTKGGDDKKYDVYLDKGSGIKGKNAATIKSTDNKIDSVMSGVGFLTQQSGCKDFAGKRIIMKGYMKTKILAGGGFFYLSIYNNVMEKPLANYDMYDKAVQGTTDWTEYQIELDVPANATTIKFGALLLGKGQMWVTDFSFWALDAEANADAAQKLTPDGAVNLNFAE